MIFFLKSINLLLLLLPFVRRRGQDYHVLLVVLLLIALFIVIMVSVRTGGPDYYQYSLHLSNPEKVFIGDQGYLVLSSFVRLFSDKFYLLTSITGLLTLIAYYRLSKYYNLSFILILCFYIIHLMVLREFTQLRFGLATSLFLIALTQKSFVFKWFIYFISVSIHFSLLLLLIIYEVYARYPNRRHLILILVAIIAFCGAASIEYFSMIDPRIDFYKNWVVEKSFTSHITPLLFLGTLSSLFFINRHNSDLVSINFYLMMTAIIMYFASLDFSYIQGRFVSIFISLYPLGIVAILNRKNIKCSMISKCLISLVILMLLARTDLVVIINQISWT